MKRAWLIGGCLLAWGLVAVDRGRAAEGVLSVEPAQQVTEWSVRHRGVPVFRYAFGPAQFKPYVKELRTLRGDDLLRDAPFDHLHHHALMYGIKVNGVNFWEETPGCGVQRPVQTDKPELGVDDRGRPRATLRQTLYWLAVEDAFAPWTNAAPLLIERRALTLTVDEAKNAVRLRWDSEFEVGTKTNQVTLTGANYHGLGLRFRQELDALAEHFTANGPVDLSGTRQDVAVYPWMAVAFDPPGRPATLVVEGDTSNARGAPMFFAMKRPFAYVSATQGLDREPLVYRKGDTWRLGYRVTVYGERRTPETVGNAR